MTTIHEIRALEAELDRRVAELLAAAEGAGQAAEAWLVMQSSWTGAATLELSPGGRAARPDTVRAVLVAIAAAFDRHAHAMQARGTDDTTAEDALWELRHRRLARLVDDSLAAYLRRVAPAPSIGALFANAAVPSGPAITGPIAPSVDTTRCRGCGSPRLGDAGSTTCPFCGTPFFAPEDP